MSWFPTRDTSQPLNWSITKTAFVRGAYRSDKSPHGTGYAVYAHNLQGSGHWHMECAAATSARRSL